VSKKLEQKQQRRLAEERRAAEQRKAAMKRNILTIGSAVLVAAIVVVAIVAQRESAEDPGGSQNVGVPEAQANCTDVEEFEEQEAEHIGIDEEHAPYNSSPPTSGPHYEIPAETTFFTDQIPPEQVVHNLEHGAIVIWYSPNADEQTLDDIEALVDQEPTATVAVPFADLESPYSLALTGWTSLQKCEQVSQDVVDQFRTDWQGEGPEKLTPQFEG
jgi:hypothetical protein